MAKFVPKLAFLAQYWPFWSIWSHAPLKNNANEVPRWFSVMWVPKPLLSSVKIRIFGPKTTIFCIFGHFGPTIGLSEPFGAMPDQKGWCLSGWYVDMWVPGLLLPPKMIMMFAPIYAFLGTHRPCRLTWCPVGWFIGDFGARAVYRKTPIHFIWINNCQGFDLGDSGGGENYTSQKISVACWLWGGGQGTIFWQTYLKEAMVKFLRPPWDDFFCNIWAWLSGSHVIVKQNCQPSGVMEVGRVSESGSPKILIIGYPCH